MHRALAVLFLLLCVGCAPSTGTTPSPQAPPSPDAASEAQQPPPPQAAPESSAPPAAELAALFEPIENGMHNVFEGQIGDREVRVAIFRDDDLLTAFCIPRGGAEDKVYTGEYAPDRIRLRPMSETAPVSIELALAEESVWEGVYTDLGVESLPVSLRLIHRTAGPGAWQRYPDHAAQAEEVAAHIQALIAADEREQLAALVAYPVAVTVGGERVEVESVGAFVARYDEIIHPAFRDMVAGAYTKYLFWNDQGALLGEPAMNIWLGQVEAAGDLRIIAINNRQPESPS